MNSKLALPVLFLFAGLCVGVSDVAARGVDSLTTYVSVCKPGLSFLYSGENLLIGRNSSDYRTRSFSKNSFEKKQDWHDVVSNIAFSYAYKLNIQMQIQDYREMFRSSLKSVFANYMDDTQTAAREMETRAFGSFFRSFSGLSEADGDFNNWRLASSLGFGSTGLKCSYILPFGVLSSSWNMEKNNLMFKFKIPLNTTNRNSGQFLNVKDVLEKSNELLIQNQKSLLSVSAEIKPPVVPTNYQP